jgi:hypothetical protein
MALGSFASGLLAGVEAGGRMQYARQRQEAADFKMLEARLGAAGDRISGLLTDPITGAMLTPDKITQAHADRLAHIMNRYRIGGEFIGLNPDVAKDNPISRIRIMPDPVEPGNLNRRHVAVDLRMKDGSIQPLTWGRSADPNDPVAYPLIGDFGNMLIAELNPQQVYTFAKRAQAYQKSLGRIGRRSGRGGRRSTADTSQFAYAGRGIGQAQPSQKGPSTAAKTMQTSISNEPTNTPLVAAEGSSMMGIGSAMSPGRISTIGGEAQRGDTQQSIEQKYPRPDGKDQFAPFFKGNSIDAQKRNSMIAAIGYSKYMQQQIEGTGKASKSGGLYPLGQDKEDEFTPFGTLGNEPEYYIRDRDSEMDNPPRYTPEQYRAFMERQRAEAEAQPEEEDTGWNWRNLFTDTLPGTGGGNEEEEAPPEEMTPEMEEFQAATTGMRGIGNPDAEKSVNAVKQKLSERAQKYTPESDNLKELRFRAKGPDGKTKAYGYEDIVESQRWLSKKLGREVSIEETMKRLGLDKLGK